MTTGFFTFLGFVLALVHTWRGGGRRRRRRRRRGRRRRSRRRRRRRRNRKVQTQWRSRNNLSQMYFTIEFSPTIYTKKAATKEAYP